MPFKHPQQIKSANVRNIQQCCLETLVYVNSLTFYIYECGYQKRPFHILIACGACLVFFICLQILCCAGQTSTYALSS